MQKLINTKTGEELKAGSIVNDITGNECAIISVVQRERRVCLKSSKGHLFMAVPEYIEATFI